MYQRGEHPGVDTRPRLSPGSPRIFNWVRPRRAGLETSKPLHRLLPMRSALPSIYKHPARTAPNRRFRGKTETEQVINGEINRRINGIVIGIVIINGSPPKYRNDWCFVISISHFYSYNYKNLKERIFCSSCTSFVELQFILSFSYIDCFIMFAVKLQ